MTDEDLEPIRRVPVYLLAELEIVDETTYAEYMRRVPATVEQHGGRYLVRGGPMQPLSGDWSATRVVVVEFPDEAARLAWQQSPEYRELAPLRERSTRSRAVILHGLPADG